MLSQGQRRRPSGDFSGTQTVIAAMVASIATVTAAALPGLTSYEFFGNSPPPQPAQQEKFPDAPVERKYPISERDNMKANAIRTMFS